MSFSEAHIFIEKLSDMLEFLIPNYVNEGKYQLVIGIGVYRGESTEALHLPTGCMTV